jgi:hypothetical protein
LVILLLAASCSPQDQSLDPNGPRPVRLEVAPSPVYVTLGSETALQVTGYNAAGEKVAAPDVAWTSDSPAVAAVSASGVLRGVAKGITRVTATAGGLSASAPVTVGGAAVELSAFPDSTFVVGATFSVDASVVDDSGTFLANPPLAWSTSDSAVVSLRVLSGGGVEVTARSAGTATIAAALEGGPSGSVELTVLPPLVGGSELIVLDFHVIEYQYPGDPRWEYAPMLQVQVVNGGYGVDVLRLDVAIPGLDPAPGFCGSIRLTDLQPHQLNYEVYGDWMISEDESGHRATAGQSATAVISYVTDDGAQSLTVTGPVVAGALPTTYSGSRGLWGSCPP